jgi:hypothetical protein
MRIPTVAVKATAVFGLLVGQLSLSAAPAGAQGIPELKAQAAMIRQEVDGTVRLMQKKILDTLSGGDRVRAEKIRLTTVNSEDISRVRAFESGGVPQIEISVGFARTMYYVADAILSDPAHAVGYINYIVAAQRENSRRVARGQDPVGIKYLYQWAGWSKAQFDARAANKQKQTDVDRTWNAVLLFMMAHEYAHHLLGHVKQTNVPLAMSREYEAAADTWASDLLLKADVGPIVGAYAFLFYAAYDCDAINHEGDRTHPADIKRFEAVVRKTIDGLDRLTVAGGSREQVRAQLESVAKGLRTEIAKHVSCLSETDGRQEVAAAPDGDICPMLQSLLTASENGFQSERGKSILQDRIWQGTKLLPRTNYCSVSLRTSSANYRCSTPDYENAMTASEVFAGYASQLQACLGAEWKRRRIGDANDPEPQVIFSRDKLEVRTSVNHDEESKRFSVSLGVTRR